MLRAARSSPTGPLARNTASGGAVSIDRGQPASARAAMCPAGAADPAASCSGILTSRTSARARSGAPWSKAGGTVRSGVSRDRPPGNGRGSGVRAAGCGAGMSRRNGVCRRRLARGVHGVPQHSGDANSRGRDDHDASDRLRRERHADRLAGSARGQPPSAPTTVPRACSYRTRKQPRRSDRRQRRRDRAQIRAARGDRRRERSTTRTVAQMRPHPPAAQGAPVSVRDRSPDILTRHRTSLPELEQ